MLVTANTGENITDVSLLFEAHNLLKVKRDKAIMTQHNKNQVQKQEIKQSFRAKF